MQLRIKLSINFKDSPKDKNNKGLDFQVMIVPNTTYYHGNIDLPEELVQIKATLKAKAQQVRSQYIRRGKPTSGNVAVSKLVISTNKSYEEEATSKA